MKKLLILAALPLIVASCAELNEMSGDFTTGGDAGIAEDSLNSSVVNNEYAESRTTAPESAPAATMTDKSLIYPGPKYYIKEPYKIEDVQYNPGEDYKYDQTGFAGITPIELNGTSTHNGEIFNTNAMIGTSKTLPLPSIVRVTNLDTGASATLRVNTSGPNVNSRLMDVSPAAARRLGMTGQTRVRVQILENESKKVRDLTLGVGIEAESPSAPPSAEAKASSSGGPYAVQIGAYYAMESARGVANRISGIGNASVVEEGGMFKVRIENLSADEARKAVDRLRREENIAPGLLKSGRWVNADSI